MHNTATELELLWDDDSTIVDPIVLIDDDSIGPSGSSGSSNYIMNGQFSMCNPQIKHSAEYIVTAATIPYYIQGYSTQDAAATFFIKSDASGEDKFSILSFAPSDYGTAGAAPTDGTPKYYIQHETVTVGTATYKDYCFLFKNVNSFACTNITFSVWAKNVAGTGTPTLTLCYKQNFGTGGSTEVTTILTTTSTLTNSWSQYSASAAVVSLVGKTIGTIGDDYIAFCVRLPSGATNKIAFTNVQLNLGTVIQTYPIEESFYKKSIFLPNMALPHSYLNYDNSGVARPTSLNYPGDVLMWDGTKYALSSPVPVGSWLGWYSEDFVPAGWISCVRQRSVPTAQFRRLYDVYGTKYGSNNDLGNTQAAVYLDTIVRISMRSQGTASFTDGACSTHFSFATEQTFPVYIAKISCVAGSNLMGGEYFRFLTPAGSAWCCWIRVNGNGSAPTLADNYSYTILDILTSDSASEVATKLCAVFNPLLLYLPDHRGLFPRVWDNSKGNDPDAAGRNARGDGTTGDVIGTTQLDAFKNHTHTYQGNHFDRLIKDNPGSNRGTVKEAISTDTGSATGGNESRGKNFYTDVIIKY